MGRQKRGKLLIPSLIAVACAAACGGSSLGGDGGDGQGAADQGGSSDATGGRYGEPTVSSGGANSIPQGGPSYAGALAGGAGGVFYGCPPSLPAAGSRCAMAPNGLGACGYTDGCGQPVLALCRPAGDWEVIGASMECNGGAPNEPTLPFNCPPQRPPSGKKCDLPASVANYQCMYVENCVDLIETCDQRHVWFLSASFSDCAGAGGAF